MSRFDLHTHTLFSDGKNTPEEMIQAAIEKGLDTIGISDHSYTFFDESYCMARNRIPEYRQAIAELKEKYSGQIKVLCGIEQDFYSRESADEYDYVIGSLHYLYVHGRYIPIDETPEILLEAVQNHFGGDIYNLCEFYFETVSRVVSQTGADIIGHLDLIQKFNEGDWLFDSHHPRYVEAARNAALELLKTGKVFEINTGAMSRGYRTVPYPAPELLQFIRAHGGKCIHSSDSHSAGTLCADIQESFDIIPGF